jgi:thiol-disulfide isomerase/thioredoxin
MWRIFSLFVLIVTTWGSRRPDANAQYVEILSQTSFDRTIREHKYIIVDMYANWCSHCIELEPEYNRLGKLLSDKANYDVTIAAAKIDFAIEDTERYRLMLLQSACATFSSPTFSLTFLLCGWSTNRVQPAS